MRENYKPLTALSIHSGTYHCGTMPFGLERPGETLQREMDQVLKNNGKYAQVYTDDVIIFLDN